MKEYDLVTVEEAEKIEKYERLRQQQQKHQDWMNETQLRLPDFCNRVFTLRSTGYIGSGFHYTLEVLLGKLIIRANDIEINWNDPRTFLADELLIEHFEKLLFEAEKTALV